MNKISAYGVFLDPVRAIRNPQPFDNTYQVGQIWINENTAQAFILVRIVGANATWIEMAGGGGGTTTNFMKDTIYASNGTTSYNLSATPDNPLAVLVFINGQQLNRNEYSVSGSQISIDETSLNYRLRNGDVIEVFYSYT